MMKDIPNWVRMVIDLKSWAWEYLNESEWPSKLNESQLLWFMLFCEEARRSE